jgi:hypothetical protein
MALTVDGNSLVFTGTVTVTNATSPSTGVCTLILSPSGGVGTLPALVAGDPGQPALITGLTVNTLPAGQNATGSLNQTSAGGAGTSSEYALTLNIPQGATGASGTTTLHSASDLTGTIAAGDIIVATSSTAFASQAFPWGNVYNASSVSAVTSTGNGSGTMGTISVPAQNNAWIPLVFAAGTVAGTTNTVVELLATLGGTSGVPIVGQSPVCAGIANQALHIGPGFGALWGSGTYTPVAAGTSAEVFLQAVGTAATADSWTVSPLSNPAASFTVVAFPVS